MARVITWLETIIRVTLLISLPFLLSRINYKLEGDHFTFCLFKNITGTNCYGCGVLRGISAFLHMDYGWAYHLNRLNVFTIPLLIFQYGRELFRNGIRIFKNGGMVVVSRNSAD